MNAFDHHFLYLFAREIIDMLDFYCLNTALHICNLYFRITEIPYFE